MRKIYSNKGFDKVYRTKDFNGFGNFEECEKCGFKFRNENSTGIHYFHRTKMILCDRCIDNHDGVTVWSDEYSAKNGLPQYPGELKESTLWKSFYELTKGG